MNYSVTKDNADKTVFLNSVQEELLRKEGSLLIARKEIECKADKPFELVYVPHIGICRKVLFGLFTREALEGFVHKSGFSSHAVWLKKINCNILKTQPVPLWRLTIDRKAQAYHKRRRT